MFRRHLLTSAFEDQVELNRWESKGHFGHSENLSNFTTAEISVGKRHSMLMSTLTICKLLCGMSKKRVLITRAVCKPNYAL